jgi:threonine dehydrogenase-like Zn-dependent dehydrogenase
MKAVIFDSKLKFVDDHAVPKPLQGEVLIRVSLAGICNTDLEITKGYRGFRGVLGHEFVGIVESANGKDQSIIGKRVVGEINCGCGKCEYCQKGLRNHCEERKTLGIHDKDGAMAEYATLPMENVYIVPDVVQDEESVFAEPLAAAFQITEQILIEENARILVLGDGKLGLLIACVMSLFSSAVTLVGKHENKLKVASLQQVETFLLKDFKMERKYDVVIESTGSPGGFELALKLVKPRGTIVLKTTGVAMKEFNNSEIVINEITVVGSRCGPFKTALYALSRKLIDVRPLISGIFPFDRAEEAFKRAQESNSLKILIDFR